jgi:hypothetical protein
LAAAAAESGDLDAAAKWQSKALEFLNDDENKARFSARLELFCSMPEIPLKAG